jgi:Protein of unknown function (DUF1553)/Protein of unknown function (DUF1549)/Concanavalin A-like lectin/glucanases superfamily/Planctomycete cytochrome C
MRFSVAFILLTTNAFVANADDLTFNRDIRPILSENCFHCHGQDPKNREAGLRLDTRDGSLESIDGHSAIVPHNATASELVKRIFSNDSDEQMPPSDSNRHLSEEQKLILRKWIDEGAAYESHWAYVPPVKTALPEVKNPNWSKQPMDRFVLSRLEREGLAPSTEASPESWLRRVSFDLAGLPPTLVELNLFATDVSSHGEQAYIDAVDRLLKSPHFGERMAIDWLDAARYADSHGFNNDGFRSMWRWRDWVIDAFNSNMPYDQFITEQLAGDLLTNPTLEQRIATGFSRNHVINSEGGIVDEEYRVEYVADRVRTMSTAWLGLSTECARCHDHKFDAITQRDYFQFFAFFNNVPEHGEDGRIANAVPMIPAPTREQQALMLSQLEAIRSLDSELSKSRENLSNSDLKSLINHVRESLLQAEETNRKDFEGLLEPAPARDHRVGNGVYLGNDSPVLSISSKKLSAFKNKSSSLTLWVKSDRDNPADVAILSSIDYSGSPADAQYGKGRELRLIHGEIEWRESSRLPVYSRIVRSVGGSLAPGQWHQIVICTGESKTASAIQFFIDGNEVETIALYDDLTNDATHRDMMVGGDNQAESPRFKGEIDELRLVDRVQTDSEIRLDFIRDALTLEPELSNDAYYRDRILGEHLRHWDSTRTICDNRSQLWRKLLALRRSLPTAMVMEELPEPRKSFVLLRGNYDAPGEQVMPGVPEKLIAPWPADAPRNRLGLAQWFTQPNHPLTARVVVNRFWNQLFGVGIVKTLEDFGSQSEWPSHPEVLDFLARDFVDGGWNVKALMKSIVLSATYRQTSSASGTLVARDPENRLLARGPRVRLPAELIRDQALVISGLLKNRIGGPSVYPYQPDKLYDGIVVGTEYPGSRWKPSRGDDLYRRSLYTFWKRTVTHPAMLTFDAPDREVCTVRRSRTNTPLQALLLWNETGYLEAARALGSRMMREGGNDEATQVSFAFRLATGRVATPEETEVLVKTLIALEQDFSRRPDDAAAFVNVGDSPAEETTSKPKLAAMMAVANVILNLDETITKN